MQNKQYIIKEYERKYLIEKNIKKFNQVIYLGPFIFLIMNCLFVLAFKLDFGTTVLLTGVLSAFTTAFLVLIGKNAKNKLESIVLEIECFEFKMKLKFNDGFKIVNYQDFDMLSQIIKVIDKEFLAITIIADGRSVYIIPQFFKEQINEEFLRDIKNDA